MESNPSVRRTLIIFFGFVLSLTVCSGFEVQSDKISRDRDENVVDCSFNWTDSVSIDSKLHQRSKFCDGFIFYPSGNNKMCNNCSVLKHNSIKHLSRSPPTPAKQARELYISPEQKDRILQSVKKQLISSKKQAYYYKMRCKQLEEEMVELTKETMMTLKQSMTLLTKLSLRKTRKFSGRHKPKF